MTSPTSRPPPEAPRKPRGKRKPIPAIGTPGTNEAYQQAWEARQQALYGKLYKGPPGRAKKRPGFKKDPHQ